MAVAKIKVRIPSVRGCSDAKLGGQLLFSVQRGDLKRVKRVIEDAITSHDTVSLNCSDEHGKTLLMHAAALPCKPIVEYLLAQPEVDVNATDEKHKAALHHVSKRDTTYSTEGCETLADVVQGLLDHGAAIDARDHKGRTALMFAATSDNALSTRVLLNAKASVNLEDVNGHTALDYAKKFSRGEVAFLLREAGADESEYDVDDARPDFVVTLRARRTDAGTNVTCCSSVSGTELVSFLLQDALMTTWSNVRLQIREALPSHAKFKLQFTLEDGKMLRKDHDATSMAKLLGSSA